ncbi:MAG: Hpt domain-containing protein [Sulfuricurvum sp.]|uniref:Hpt domain-containing protein n=1 Tax=Sulfuricurvum sp. TaxID=2025608 RepID=UPI00260271DC|nr:Hpt domain-containing protein [Sulfuricurvum sp.]MDD2828727.1 Hpt domain-containing protein [Sulfuricurvum sp.]MDD4949305.1 Hpt domain-containing protein [Sulfuricurvum sp.]
MRSIFIFLFLITFSTIYANEQQGYKVVLASFSTFDEAKEKLDLFASTFSGKELALQEAYHFEVLARPSGKAFIVTLEPFDKKESATVVLTQFKKLYPDAYINGYFGPTDGSILWKNKSVEPTIIKNEVLPKSIPTPLPIEITIEDNKSHAWIWVSLGFLVFVGIGVLFLTRKGKKTDRLKEQIIKYKEELKANFDVFVSWSYEDALKRAGGDEENLNSAINLFLRDTQRLINNIKEAMDKGDFAEIQKQTHQLKSASASVSATTLRLSSKKLEVAAREKNHLLVETVFVECETILNKTIVLIKERVVNPKSPHPFIDKKTQLRTQLEFLRQNINKSLFIDAGYLGAFDEATDEKIAVVLEELKKSIEKLEYEKALELIERIEEMIQ